MGQAKSEVERFDALVKGLKPLLQPNVEINGHDLNMGGRNTPVMSVQDEKIVFSAFRPQNKRSRQNYSQSVLFQSLVYRQEGEISYPAPARQIYLRRNLLTTDINSTELDEVEAVFNQCLDAVNKLSPAEAKGLGFSKNFVRRLKIRRVSHFLASYLRIAES